MKMRAATRAALLGWLMLSLALVVVVGPFLWIAVASFKQPIAILSGAWSFTPTLDNYADVLLSKRSDFLAGMRNSLIVATVSTAIVLVVGTLAAYSLHRFAWARWVTLGFLGWTLAFHMIPVLTLVGPWYLAFKELGLYDTRLALILTHVSVNLAGTPRPDPDGCRRCAPRPRPAAARRDGRGTRSSPPGGPWRAAAASAERRAASSEGDGPPPHAPASRAAPATTGQEECEAAGDHVTILARPAAEWRGTRPLRPPAPAAPSRRSAGTWLSGSTETSTKSYAAADTGTGTCTSAAPEAGTRNEPRLIMRPSSPSSHTV